MQGFSFLSRLQSGASSELLDSAGGGVLRLNSHRLSLGFNDRP